MQSIATPGLRFARPVLTLRALFLGLGPMALLVTLPFVGAEHRLPLASVHQEFLAIGLGLIWVLAGLVFGASGREQVAFPVLLWGPLLVALAILAQWIVWNRVPPIAAGFGIVYFVWGALLLIAVATTLRLWGGDRVATVLAWSLTIGAVALGITGVLNALLPDSVVSTLLFRGITCVVCGNLPQANLYADYLWLGIISAFTLCVTARLRASRTWLVVILLLTLTFLSKSRSAYLFCAWTLVWLAVWQHQFRVSAGGTVHRRTGRLMVPALLLAALCVQGALALAGQDTGLQRVVGSLQAQASVDGIRSAHLRAAFAIFREHPWFGAGFGTFRELYPPELLPQGVYIEGTLIPTRPEHSHNLLAEWAVDFGVVGWALLAVWLWQWWRQSSFASDDTAAWLGIGWLGVLGIHSMLEYPLWYAHFWALALIAFTLTIPSGRYLRVGPVSRLALTATVLVLTLACGLTYWMYTRHELRSPAGIPHLV